MLTFISFPLSLFKEWFYFFHVYVCLSVCGYSHIYVGAHKDHKRGLCSQPLSASSASLAFFL